MIRKRIFGSHLNGLWIGIIKFENCRTSIFYDHRKRRKLSRDLGGFPEMTPGWKMFFDLSMFDIQLENKKNYSVWQIVQNNDLPAYALINSIVSEVCLWLAVL